MNYVITHDSKSPGLREFIVDFLAIMHSWFYRKSNLNRLKKPFQNAQKKSKKWIAIHGELLSKNEQFLNFLLASAPRWNVHALIVASPDLEVNDNIHLDLQSLSESCEYWSLSVISAEVGNVYSISSAKVNEYSHTIPLEAGHYKLVFRLYEFSNFQYSPELIIDDHYIVESQEVIHDSNTFYERLRDMDISFLKKLNLYPMRAVKYKRLIGEERTKKIFLPVADVETKFSFGYLRKNETVHIDLPGINQKNKLVFFCFYNEKSLPVDWHRVNGDRFLYTADKESGCYVIRSIEN